jgi:hypothetical protein
MGSGDLPLIAKKSISNLKLNLLLDPAPFHCLLTPAAPARAAPVRPGGEVGRTKNERFLERARREEKELDKQNAHCHGTPRFLT